MRIASPGWLPAPALIASHVAAVLLVACVGCDSGASSGPGLRESVVGGCGGEEPPAWAPATNAATESDTTEATLAITATQRIPGTILASVTGYSAACCITFEPTADVDPETLEIHLGASPQSNEQCDCMCSYDFYYEIGDLSAGTWTVDFDSVSTSVTIDPAA